MPYGTMIKKHHKSSFLALNVRGCDEPIAIMDTVYPDSTPAIEGHETCTQIFAGNLSTLLRTLFANVVQWLAFSAAMRKWKSAFALWTF